jgi:hypothetical protein
MERRPDKASSGMSGGREVLEAIRYLSDGRARGKVVITA